MDTEQSNAKPTLVPVEVRETGTKFIEKNRERVGEKREYDEIRNEISFRIPVVHCFHNDAPDSILLQSTLCTRTKRKKREKETETNMSTSSCCCCHRIGRRIHR